MKTPDEEIMKLVNELALHLQDKIEYLKFLLTDEQLMQYQIWLDTRKDTKRGKKK